MWDNFIGRNIRYRARWLMLAAGLILASVAVFLALTPSYWHNYFNGPFSLSAAELRAASNAGDFSRDFVTLRPERVTPAGVEIPRRNGKR
ncbi:MAG: hypothetical protein ACJ8F7_04745 [Gemmataceae bacterium]